MRYLLDSNIIIKLTTGRGEVLRQRAADCLEGDIVTSAIAMAEVLYGSVNEKQPLLMQLDPFMRLVKVLDFDIAAARAYATLPFKRAGHDRLIAAHTLSLGLTLVTDNEWHFAEVPGLRVENWTLPR